MQRINVYFIPGLAASPKIFENIQLDATRFSIHYLEWVIPDKGWTIKDYAQLMSNQIKNEPYFLVGVSFGGIVAQEISKIKPPIRLIIISSVRSPKEFPMRLWFSRLTQFHRIIPMRWVSKIDILVQFNFGKVINNRLKLYQLYLSVNNSIYLKWAVNQLINWQPSALNVPLIHIHGDRDAIFPIKRISNCLVVKKGTHTMILHRARWFNENLPSIILDALG